MPYFSLRILIIIIVSIVAIITQKDLETLEQRKKQRKKKRDFFSGFQLSVTSLSARIVHLLFCWSI